MNDKAISFWIAEHACLNIHWSVDTVLLGIQDQRPRSDHYTDTSMNFYQLADFQLLACIYKSGEKWCGSLSADFLEAS